MSRLDSFIRRLEAQRSVLNWAAGCVAAREGLILELGLGNGRTYDHLRAKLPGRDIHVFERAPSPNPQSMPPRHLLVVGEMETTLPAFAARHGPVAVLIHVDVTTGVAERDRLAFAWLPEHVARLARPGGLIVTGWPLDHPAFEAVQLPADVPEGRYFAYRRREGSQPESQSREA